MFSPMGALGAFGGGLMSGLPTGMDLRSKYIDFQAEQLLGQSLGDIGGLSSLYQPTVPPGEASQAAQPQQAQQQQQAVPGGDMPGWQQSIPGAQAGPPGTPTPPGVPSMPGPQMAALGGAGPIPGPYSTAIKGFEGYTPVAQRDYSQYSGGFGTRARPGERLSGQEWSSRYQDELYQAAKQVDEHFPGLPSGPRAALVDMTYNTGTKWMQGNLGRAVAAQDWPLAQQLMQQYVRAGGQVLPGLQSRRAEGARWMGGAEPSAGAIAAGERAEAQSRGEKVLAQARDNLMAGRPLELPQLAQLIERRAGSDASPMVKFRAMQKGFNLLNQTDQTRFNQMMRILEFEQHQKQFGLSEQREERAQRTEARRVDAQNLSLARNDPEYKSIQGSLGKYKQRLDVVEELQNKTLRIGEKLIDLGNKKSVTGVPVFQAWIDAGRRATGDPLVKEWDTQVRAYASDIGRIMGSPGATVLPQGSIREARELTPESMTLAQLEAVQRALKYDAKIGREESNKIYQHNLKRARQIFERYGVKQPVDEPESETTETETEAPAAAPSGGGGGGGWGKAEKVQ